jgi:ADP-heptose:LPS heptosyltransferase
LPEQQPNTPQLAAFNDMMRAQHFDLALQLHGSGHLSNALVLAFGATVTAGFVPASQQVPGADRYWLPWSDTQSEVTQLLRLPACLGYQPQGVHLEFPLLAADDAAWQQLAHAHQLQSGAYLCLHPGARMDSRRWPLRHYALLARRLVADGWRVLLTGTPGEAMLVRELAVESGVPLVNLCGQTSLATLAATIAHARLLICNDTGVSHIAAAVGTPSVVVACGSDVARWAPLDRARHRVLAAFPPCRPCMYQACPIGHPCALAIEIEQVYEAASQLLAAELADA